MADKEDNIWRSILAQSTKDRTRPNSVLVVLGDAQSGKTTLLHELQGSSTDDDGGNGEIALEYSLLTAKKDQDDDQQTPIDVWQLAGGAEHQDLLSVALNSSTIHRTMVFIVVDLSKPFTLMESMSSWFSILEKHVTGVFNTMSSEDVDALQNKAVERLCNFVESGSGAPKVELGPGVLETNLGVPVVVVGTKADSVSSLQTEYGIDDQQLDFVQMKLRSMCLQYGASLIYTSVKEQINTKQLNDYIDYTVHQVDAVTFPHKAQTLDKEAVLVPAGWDSQEKVKLLAVSGYQESQAFEDVIQMPKRAQQPSAAAFASSNEVRATDEQVLLQKLKQQLEDSGSIAVAASKPAPDYSKILAGQAASLDPSPGHAVAMPPAVGTPPPPAAAGAANKDGVNQEALSSFFQSLLNKNRGPATSPSAGASTKQDTRKDAEKELLNLRRKSGMLPGK